VGVKENRERTTGKEEYYTNSEVVSQCVAQCRRYLKEQHLIVEPAAGDGAFLRGFTEAGFKNRVIAWDKFSSDPEIPRRDLFDIKLEQYRSTLFVITNPPFGRANSLSVKFFNYLANQSEYIAFIVPISWRKWSIQNRLDKRFYLVSDTTLPLSCFHRPNGEPLGTALRTVFQIWEKRKTLRKKIVTEDRGYFKKVCPKDADVAFTAFGYKVGVVETDFPRIPNTCKLFLSVKNKKVIDALQRIDVKQFTENCAYTECVSMQELRYLLNEFFDGNF
jgi:hypothetical protein